MASCALFDLACASSHDLLGELADIALQELLLAAARACPGGEQRLLEAMSCAGAPSCGARRKGGGTRTSPPSRSAVRRAMRMRV